MQLRLLTLLSACLFFVDYVSTMCPHGGTGPTAFSIAMEKRNLEVFEQIKQLQSEVFLVNGSVQNIKLIRDSTLAKILGTIKSDIHLIGSSLKNSSAMDKNNNHIYAQLDYIIWEISKIDALVQDACKTIFPACNATEHRLYSSECNNLLNPRWGAANIGFRRLLPAAYEDGIGVPRGGFPFLVQTNRSLPSARFISQEITKQNLQWRRQEFGYSDLFTAFGQFMSHDFSFSPEGKANECCKNPTNPECFPIRVPKDDNHFTSTTCLDLRRTVPFCNMEGKIREQMNAVTSVIDANTVYGSDEAQALKIRTQVDGLLKVNPNFDRLIPILNGSLSAGDMRLTESPMLTTLHTLFLREHNRLAGKLKKKSKSKDDEFIYQKARSLLIAELQSIVYNEYLPILLGAKLMKSRNFYIKPNPQTVYNNTINPSTTNSFATASFRFGHTMVMDKVTLKDPALFNISQFPLHENFFNPNLYHSENGQGFVQTLLGLMSVQSKMVGPNFSREITDFLYFDKMLNTSSDLLAKNLQRGRDHGIPGYNQFRELCGLSKIKSLSTPIPPSFINRRRWNVLRQMYSSPEDIDLFVGGVMEKTRKGMPGPTFTCINAEQFEALLKGDRFFFTHVGEKTSYNFQQRKQLNRRRLRDIICENTAIQRAQLNVFKTRGWQKPCSRVNSLDVSLFL